MGDPLLDLAWVVMNWPEDEAGRPTVGYVDYEGLPFRDDLLERYATMSGRDVDEIDYYVILARFKLAIVLGGRLRPLRSWRRRQPENGSLRPRRLRPGP